MSHTALNVYSKHCSQLQGEAHASGSCGSGKKEEAKHQENSPWVPQPPPWALGNSSHHPADSVENHPQSPPGPGGHRDPHGDLSWLGISWKAAGLGSALPDPGKEGAAISTPKSPLIQPLPLLTPLGTR